MRYLSSDMENGAEKLKSTDGQREKCVLLIKTHVWPLDPSAKANGVGLLQTCERYVDAIAEYNKLSARKYDYEFCILFDASKNKQGVNPLECDVHETTLEKIRELGYIGARSPKHRARTVSSRKHSSRHAPILWYNSEYLLLDYYIKNNSDYKYYWVIEYDVLPTGDFCKYLLAYDKVEDDFLTYNLKMKSDPELDFKGKHWMWWDCIAGFKFIEQLGSYLPVNRFSNRAVSELIRAYDEGAHGYCEILIPSVIYAAGMTCNGLWLTANEYWDDCKLFHKRKELLGRNLPPPVPRPEDMENNNEKEEENKK